MLKIPQKLGKGIAFWRPINPNTLLAVGNYVQVAVFGSVDPMGQTGSVEFYRGDSIFVQAADSSEVNFNMTFNDMTLSIPDPTLAGQYPQGNWDFFDLFGLNYVYQYGAYNLSSYQARAYHVGPSTIHAAPEGQLLLRTFGGSPNRVLEMEFHRVRATDFEFPLNKTNFWTMAISFIPMTNPAYTYAGAEGTVYTFRDFWQTLPNLGI